MILENVVAVVVAYNRRHLLEETLAALVSQTTPLAAVVVVDNASTDGSADAARTVAADADIVVLSRNTGGAGGFTVGIERALGRHDADLVWVMDDDTVPSATALEELLKVHRALPEARVLASRVVWTDGRDHPMNTPRQKRLTRRPVRNRAAAAAAYPVRSASFVSCMFPAALIRERGLPMADYFLWNDDFEYTARLVRGGVGVVCRKSVVEHRTKIFSGIQVDPGERFQLEVRNKVWVFGHSRALSLGEKVFYAAVSAARWADVFRRSSRRAVLWHGLRSGLRAGLFSRPKSNAVALAGLGDVTSSIAAFEGRPSDV